MPNFYKEVNPRKRKRLSKYKKYLRMLMKMVNPNWKGGKE